LFSFQYCVKKRAYESVKAVLDISDQEAWAAVEDVFEKCYADLEPIGRRIRRNSAHMERAYADGINAGYD
jgi:inner membrane protease ATP23